MRLSIFAALIAAVSAAPVTENVSELARRAGCSALTPHSVSGLGSATGPFKIKASAPRSKLNGNYAHAGAPNFVPFVVFGVTPAQVARRATEFYIDSSSRLVSIQDGVVYTAYEATPSDAKGSYVSIGAPGQFNTNGEVYCAIDKTTCALNCGLFDLTYNCLGSTHYQPDWLITATSEASKPACVKFQPIAVPG